MGVIADRIKHYLKTKDTDPAIGEEAKSRLRDQAARIGVRLAMNLSRQILPYTKKIREGVTLYPSSATKCPRQLAYQALEFPMEPMLPSTKLKFIAGDLIETAALALIASAFLVTGNNEEQEFEIAGKPRRGRSDGTIHMEKRKNLELKSMGAYGFKKFVGGELDDTWGYLGQANVYARTKLKLDQIDEPGATVFVGVDRESGAIHDVEVPYEPKYALLADMNFAHVEAALGQKKLPNRPFELGKDGKLPLICSYCPVKYSCYASPGQRVKFDENDDPIYDEGTTQIAQMFMTKGANGPRPSWRVVNV